MMRFRPALGHQRVEQTCSNRAATRVNLLKGQEMRNRSNAAICGDLARSRKLQQTIRLLSHGRGRWFEPSIAHSEDTARAFSARSEEHTSELQSRQYLVCRLLLEKKKTTF